MKTINIIPIILIAFTLSAEVLADFSSDCRNQRYDDVKTQLLVDTLLTQRELIKEYREAAQRGDSKLMAILRPFINDDFARVDFFSMATGRHLVDAFHFELDYAGPAFASTIATMMMNWGWHSGIAPDVRVRQQDILRMVVAEGGDELFEPVAYTSHPQFIEQIVEGDDMVAAVLFRTILRRGLQARVGSPDYAIWLQRVIALANRGYLEAARQGNLRMLNFFANGGANQHSQALEIILQRGHPQDVMMAVLARLGPAFRGSAKGLLLPASGSF